MCSTHCIYNIHYLLYIVLCILYIIQCVLYTIHRTLRSPRPVWALQPLVSTTTSFYNTIANTGPSNTFRGRRLHHKQGAVPLEKPSECRLTTRIRSGNSRQSAPKMITELRAPHRPRRPHHSCLVPAFPQDMPTLTENNEKEGTHLTDLLFPYCR